MWLLGLQAGGLSDNTWVEKARCMCEHALRVQIKKEKGEVGKEIAVIFIYNNDFYPWLPISPHPPFTQTTIGSFTQSLAFSFYTLGRFNSAALGGQHEVI